MGRFSALALILAAAELPAPAEAALAHDQICLVGDNFVGSNIYYDSYTCESMNTGGSFDTETCDTVEGIVGNVYVASLCCSDGLSVCDDKLINPCMDPSKYDGSLIFSGEYTCDTFRTAFGFLLPSAADGTYAENSYASADAACASPEKGCTLSMAGDLCCT